MPKAAQKDVKAFHSCLISPACRCSNTVNPLLDWQGWVLAAWPDEGPALESAVAGSGKGHRQLNYRCREYGEHENCSWQLYGIRHGSGASDQNCERAPTQTLTCHNGIEAS